MTRVMAMSMIMTRDTDYEDCNDDDRDETCKNIAIERRVRSSLGASYQNQLSRGQGLSPPLHALLIGSNGASRHESCRLFRRFLARFFRRLLAWFRRNKLDVCKVASVSSLSS